ncbi:MAG: alpha-hydroxy acid oxidase [Comamonas sp.]
MHTRPPPSGQPPLPQIPADIGCALDYELLAPHFMAAPRFAYVAGGCGHDLTVAANRRAFDQWAMVPRLLRDVRQGHTRCSIAGQGFTHPLLLAPVAHQRLAHAQAERESARAAAAMQACFVASTLSSVPLEEIAAHGGPQRWFQLYLQPQRADTLDLLARAERAGYQAIVLTLDAAIQMASRRALQAGFVMPPDCTPANLQGYGTAPLPQLTHDASRIFQGLMRQAATWEDLDWLLAHTRLPVWVKGVMHADDARNLQARGVAGIIVSNHGGRGLDGAPGTLAALPAVRAAVGPHYPVLLDGGVRSGSDVFKALALGAHGVLIGRLQVYALAVAGALGVAHMLKALREELEVCMALTGCVTLDDIHPGCLLPAQL